MSSVFSIIARDSLGNQISLLNDDPVLKTKKESIFPEPISTSTVSSCTISTIIPSYSSISLPSHTPAPEISGLLHSDSYDSPDTTSRAPLAFGPVFLLEHEMQPSAAPWYRFFKEHDAQDGHRSFYPNHPNYPEYTGHILPHIGVYRGSPYCDMYKEASYTNKPVLEKVPKRYPCRLKASHGCDKTFTTSSHASRHSKIHTAEKAVVCIYHGCQKTFTRRDNMKQHLSTHYKIRRHKASGRRVPLQRNKTPHAKLHERRRNRCYSIDLPSKPQTTVLSPIPSHGFLDKNRVLPPIPSNERAVRRKVSSKLDLLAVAASSQVDTQSFSQSIVRQFIGYHPMAATA